MKLSWVLLFTLLVFGVGIAMYFFSSRRVGAEDEVIGYVNYALSARDMVSENNGGGQLKVGESYVYRYDYSVQGNQGVNSLDLSVYGDLNVRILLVEKERVYLGMQFNRAKVQQGGNVGSFDFGVLLNVLDSKGRIQAQITSKKLNDFSKSFIVEQLNIQAVIPNHEAMALGEWSTEERDSIGSYNAEYIKQPSGVITKEKTRYHTLSNGFYEQVSVVQSFSEMTLGSFWVDDYGAVESIRSLHPKTGELNYTEFQKFKKNSGQHPANNFLSQISLGLTSDELLEVVSNQEVPRSFSLVKNSITQHHDKATPLWLGSAAMNLSVNSSIKVQFSGALAEVENLREWILGNPEDIELIYSHLRKDFNLLESVVSRMIGILEMVSALPQTQSVLAKIIADNKLPWIYRIQAAICAGRIGVVNSPILLDVLWSEAFKSSEDSTALQQQLRDSSLYALGQLAENNIELAEKLEKRLRPMLVFDKSISIDDTITAIKALGNAGHNSYATDDYIKDIFEAHGEDRVRLAALDFLGDVPGQKYSEVVIVALADQSKDIRLSAAKILLGSKYADQDDVVFGLMSRLTSEDDIHVKGALYLALSPHRERHPEIDVLVHREIEEDGGPLSAYIDEAFR